MAIDLTLVRTKLAQRTPRIVTASEAAEQRAAVAAILREERHGPEVLLIRRAERPGDPWSGHMAFPGGRASQSDPDLLSTAIRETREEVGLDLVGSEVLGQLDDLPAVARAKRTGLVITPFVFALDEAPQLALNHEVAEAVWAPLEPLASGASATTFSYEIEGRTLSVPGLRVGPHIVWGLTYRMLQMLFDALHR